VPSAYPTRFRSVLRCTRTVGALWLFWLVPAFMAVQLIRLNIHLGVFGFDFDGTMWDGGRAVLEGRGPYPSPDTLQPIPELLGSPFCYPPVILWLAVPLGALPEPVAEAIWAVLLFAGVALALRLVGLRDWRCYGIALLSVPVLKGVTTGNVTLLLVLLVAVAWRYRDSRWACPLALGIAVGLKLILWPLLVWLIATRRFRSTVVAVAVAVVSVMGSWALIGFQGLREYPQLLHVMDEAFAFKYVSVSALAVSLGAPEHLAHTLQYVVGLALIASGAVIAMRGDGDRRSFSVMVIATFVLTPIVWDKNLTLLFIPMAIIRPRLDPLWLLAWAALWVEGLGLREAHVIGGGGPMLLRCIVILGFVACVLIATAWRPERRPALRRLDLRPVADST
jgi:hypothetical protein